MQNSSGESEEGGQEASGCVWCCLGVGVDTSVNWPSEIGMTSAALIPPCWGRIWDASMKTVVDRSFAE